MAARSRFAKEDLASLSVGDVIRYKALYQSRSGFIARIQMEGRIERLTASDPRLTTPPYIEGELRDESGELQPFKLTARDRVYRQIAPAEGSHGDARAAQVLSDRASDHDVEQAL